MDIVNKLRSTVSSTVSSLSGVLPGNPVTREYEVTNHVASAGPGLLWKIYQGYKKSTKQEAAIFVFEKRHLEKFPKAERDLILETLKRGVAQLTRLRHPQILTVQHSMEESRESLAFATEPVFASLANLMGKTENMPSPPPKYLNNFKLYDLEIKYGLLQVGEGLAFLHSDVKLLHRNICLESIVVNQQGAWKIFGFDFCVLNQEQSDGRPHWPFTEYEQHSHPTAQPNLDFLAPECGLTLTHSPASDMYSLGMTIFAIHNEGQPWYTCNGDYQTYKRNVQSMKQVPASKLLCVAEGLRDIVKLMLNSTPEVRADAHQFIKISYFEDVGVKTLNYLDSLFQWDNLQKSQFYKGLPEVINKLPHRVCLNRIMPCLSKEFVNPTMVPFVLPNVLLMAEKCTKEEFCQKVLPGLKPVMKIQEPIQVLLIFMQKMELLLQLTPAEEVKSDVLPMLYRALESDAQQIQELCLSVLPTFASMIDYPAMKNALLPRIKRLCINTSFLSVRVNCLVCLGKLLEHLDKWLVLDEVLPFLPQIPSREPAVLMGILGIYKLALTHKKLGITKEVMATKIIPFLMPLCIENGLTLAQFNALVTLVKDMVARVESEHRTKIEQLSSIQQQTNSVQPNIAQAMGSQLIAAPQPKTELDQMFSSLGLDDFTSLDNTSNNLPKSSTSGSISSLHNSNSSSSLSIQDKQRQDLFCYFNFQDKICRIANQQEAQMRLQTQAPILPASAPTPSKPQVKDLTSTLMESQLKQMTIPTQSWSQPKTATSPASPSNTFSAFQSTPALPWGGPASRPSSISPGNQWSGTPNVVSNLNMTSGFSNPSLSSITSPTSGNVNNGWSMAASSPRPAVPLGSGMMSSMMSPQQTSMSNSFPQSGTSTKPLSASEINDLLS
ncbi:SCY1-like protein 2 [Frankliniella fusca]|uniref:SCY1-like protein 2 n=1 Tax=Frankliniella fusca TaxID=407009 RepID=A0AAE1HVD6_9NEOP|nr:SCY1-like protein 2 [Frankliniella fusca]